MKPPAADPGPPVPVLARVMPPDDDPYRALAAFGVSSDSSMSEVHQGGLQAQRAGALTPERRRAWKALRDPISRLAVDLLHLPTGSPPGDGEPAEAEVAVPEPRLPALGAPDPVAVCQAVGPLPLPLVPPCPESRDLPPLEVDPWELLQEACSPPPRTAPPLAEPGPFLEGYP